MKKLLLIIAVLLTILLTGLIVGSFVPLTMLTSLAIMRALDIELQRMSIASLIIALGLLVDNAIGLTPRLRDAWAEELSWATEDGDAPGATLEDVAAARALARALGYHAGPGSISCSSSRRRSRSASPVRS